MAENLSHTPAQDIGQFCEAVGDPRKPAKAKLGRRAVDAAMAAREPGKRSRLWFIEPAGLFLNVTPNGSAAYYLRFKRSDGTGSEVAIGAANRITPEIAGAKARQLINGLTLTGSDPVSLRREKTAQAKADKAKTFKALSEAFMAAAENQDISGKTLDSREGMLRNHILPVLGDQPANALKRSDIRECVRGVQKGIRAENEDNEKAGNRSANMAKSLISQIYSWGIDEELVENNPAQFKKMFDDTPMKRVGKMTDAKLRTFWQTLRDEEKEAQFAEGRSVSIAIRLCMVTMQRPNEVVQAHKADFDWEARIWRIREDKTKTNALYEVPLTQMAVELFEEAFAMSKSDWAFPGKPKKDKEGPVSPSVTSKHWLRVRERLLEVKKIPDSDVQLYDCKRFARTRLRQGLGFSREVAERCINHSQKGDDADVYDVADYAEDVRRAHEAWCQELKRIISGRPLPSNVVPLRQVE